MTNTTARLEGALGKSSGQKPHDDLYPNGKATQDLEGVARLAKTLAAHQERKTQPQKLTEQTPAPQSNGPRAK